MQEQTRIGTIAQRNIFEKLVSWMKEIYGEQFFTHPEHPSMVLRSGSANVHIDAIPWGDSDAYVNVYSYVVTEPRISPELLYFLLQKNSSFPFGAFSIDQEGDILFSHSILGSTCDKDELKTSVAAVSVMADEYDDAITARWGGKRAADRY